jgi:hypothetical protein
LQQSLRIGKVCIYKTFETAKKEVQDSSCHGPGGIPQLQKVPQDWGIRGLIDSISAVSIKDVILL